MNMVMYTIIKQELKIFRKDRAAVIMLFTLPFLFIWLFMQAFSPYLYSSRYSEKFAIAIVDNDRTTASKMIVSQFETAVYLQDYVKVHHTDESTALKMLNQNRISGIIIIPPEFISSIYQGENKPFTYIGNKSRQATSDLVKNQLLSATNLVSAGQSGVITVWRYTKWGGGSPELQEQQLNESLYKFTMNSFGRNRIFTAKTVSSIPDVKPAEYFTAALLIVFATFLGIRGMKSLVNEKASGLTNRLRASPVKNWQIIGGKFLVTFLLVVIQIALILLATGIVFDNYLGGPVANMALIVAASAFAVAAWSIFVACISPTPQAADLLGYLGTPLLAMIGGNIYPLVAMPEVIKGLSNFSFNKWAMDGFLKLFAGDPSAPVTNDALMLFITGSMLLAGATGIFTLSGRK